MLRVGNFERSLVAARPDQMYGWPGIAKVGAQEILVAASERKYHVDPFGRDVVIRSLDAGRTWQLPQEVYNSELDDRDANLVTMGDGTVVLAGFTSVAFEQKMYTRPEWQKRIARVTPRMREELAGTWMLRSSDGGDTWETLPRRLPAGIGLHTGPAVLSDNALACVARSKDTGGRSVAYISRDVGESWEELGQIPDPPKENKDGTYVELTNESHILELEPEHLMVLFRASTPGYLYQSFSEDTGKTWTQAMELPIWGYPPHLIRLQSGAILCSYGHRREPWSLRAVLSYDDGRTWDIDNIITLDQWEDKPDMGYPVSVEIDPGEILTVYYCSRQPIVHCPEEEKTYKRGSTPEGLLSVKYTLSDC